jgi:hypothetical protein
VARSTFLPIALAVSLLISSTAWGQATEDQSAIVEEIIARLESREEAIETLHATMLCIERFNFVKPGTQPPQAQLIEDDAVALVRKAQVKWEITHDGRGRMEADIQRRNLQLDGTAIEREETIVSTFDGTAGRWLEIKGRLDAPTGRADARTTHRFQCTHDSPFELATEHNRVPLSQLLRDRQATLVENQTWEERPVVVLELPPFTVRDDYILKQRFWIDPDRGTAVRRELGPARRAQALGPASATRRDGVHRGVARNLAANGRRHLDVQRDDRGPARLRDEQKGLRRHGMDRQQADRRLPLQGEAARRHNYQVVAA